MDPKTRLRRHSQLWETGTARVQSLAIGGVIFAVIILLNVIEPYWEIERDPKFAELRAAVEELQERQNVNESHITDLKGIGETLDEIKQDINGAPWSDEIQELLDFCRGGCPRNTRPKADAVITTIANELQTLIVKKFRAAIVDADMAEDFEHHATAIETAINDWRDEKLKIVWYLTPAMKSEAGNQAGEVARLSAMEAESKLGGLSIAATNAITSTTTALEQKQSELNAEENELGNQIREKDERIERAMKNALPGWATGLFTVKRMIDLYPWILISLTAFMLVSAWNAGRHFRGMADAEGWSAEERRDPLLSSPWTLTRRGNTGSTITALHYLAVLGILIYCVARSFAVAQPPETAGQSEDSALATPPSAAAIHCMPNYAGITRCGRLGASAVV